MPPIPKYTVLVAILAVLIGIILAYYKRWTAEMEQPVSGGGEVALHEQLARLFVEQNTQIEGQAEEMVGYTAVSLYCTLTIQPELVQAALPDKKWRDGLFRDDTSHTFDGIVRINLTVDAGARFSVRLNIPNNDENYKLLDDAAPSGVPDHNQIDLLFAEGLKQFVFDTYQDMICIFNLELGKSKSVAVKALYALGNIRSLLKSACKVFLARRALDPTTGLVSKDYYGGLPFAAGPHGAIKWAMLSKQTSNMPAGAVKQNNTNLAADAAAYMKDLEEWLLHSDGGAKWDFCIQKHVESFDLDNAAAKWDEKVSPYMPVGTLVIPSQPVKLDTELNQYISPHGHTAKSETLQFNPWNQLVAIGGT